MKLDINLTDDDALREVVHHAILESISAEKRDALVQAAIRHLLLPVKDYNGKPSSPLQEAFNRAVEFYANRVVQEQLAQDTVFKKAVDDTIQQALAKFADSNREAVAEKMAAAMASAMKLERY